METADIAVIPGDGIGPEVIEEGLKVLENVTEGEKLKLNFRRFPLGADHYLSTGETLSAETKADLKKFDAIYMGAVGDPRVESGVLEKGILLNIRFSFDQYINLRPIKLRQEKYTPLKDKKPADIDIMVIRENTEGLYVDSGGFVRKNTEQEIAIQEMVNSYYGVSRVIDYAYNFAADKNKNLTLCDKSNVLGYAHDLWQRVFRQKGEEFNEVSRNHILVDALVMKLVRNPEELEVIVTCNIFGDIITDLGAELQGGMGMAVSANINPQGLSMFEPVHGSAPDIAGEGIANPLAAILAGAEMLEKLGYPPYARKIRQAVTSALQEDKITVDMKGELSTSELGNYICGVL